ncbi:hypothetical protein GQ457_06G011380 [Hibiscus cannabinus]
MMQAPNCTVSKVFCRFFLSLSLSFGFSPNCGQTNPREKAKKREEKALILFLKINKRQPIFQFPDPIFQKKFQTRFLLLLRSSIVVGVIYNKGRERIR